MEEAQFVKRNGRIMNPSLAGHHVPVQMNVPETDVIWTDMESAFETSRSRSTSCSDSERRTRRRTLLHLMPGAARTDGQNPRRTNGLHDSKFMQAVVLLKFLVGPE